MNKQEQLEQKIKLLEQEELKQDRLLYGQSFCIENTDGTYTRIPPKEWMNWQWDEFKGTYENKGDK